MFYDSSSVEWWQFLYTFGIMWATGLMAAGLLIGDRETSMQLSETGFGKVILVWVMASIFGTGYYTAPLSFFIVLVHLVQYDVMPVGALVIVVAWFWLGLLSFGSGILGRFRTSS